MFILAGSALPLRITGLTSCYNIHTSRSREIDPKKQRPRRVINNKRCRRVCGAGCGVSEGEGVCGWLYPPPSTQASGCGGIDPSAPRSAVRLGCNPQFRRRPLEASLANSLHSLTPHYLSTPCHFTATTITLPYRSRTSTWGDSLTAQPHGLSL